MRSVSELYDKHAGEDIYVVGTGPSLRVFPKSFLDGRISLPFSPAMPWDRQEWHCCYSWCFVRLAWLRHIFLSDADALGGSFE